MAYDIEKIRQQVKQKIKKIRDPSEFRVPKVEEGKTLKFRFFVLPPLSQGDTCNEGKSTCEVGAELFYIPSGAHYIDNKRIGCPRVINDEECQICQYGFDLMQEVDNSTKQGKDRRSAISKQIMPAQYYLVNLYFPSTDVNPEEVRGRVLWWNAPKTVVDKWLDCLYRDDDGGDPSEPLPYGVFFDENAASMFQLEVCKDGQMNSYKTSKFLTTIKPRPICAEKDGKAITKRIADVLSKRHNLYEKLPTINYEEIAKVAAALSGRAANNAASSGFDHDEEGVQDQVEESKSTVDESASKQPAKTATKQPATKTATAAKQPAAAATKQPAKKAAKQAEPVEAEPVEEVVDEPIEEVVDEPIEEVIDEPVEEVAEESEEQGESDSIEDEVDRLLDELN